MRSLAFVVISLCVIGALTQGIIKDWVISPITKPISAVVGGLAGENSIPFEPYVKSLGYPFEEHTIQTKDGYLLTFYRIQARGQTEMTSKTVVYLQHGLLDSADSWVVNTENNAPAFILANKGYDVWLGNSRGNKYSRKHATLNPDKNSEYWQFTWQHMAEQDLPAAFAYIAEKTKRKVNYMGHSQGTLIMFAALAEAIPEVKANIGTFIALAPIVHVHHIKSPLFRTVADTPLASTLLYLGANEFMAPNFLGTRFSSLLCKFMPAVCKSGIDALSDLDSAHDEASRYPFLTGHFPSGTSTLDLAHFRQMVLNPGLQLLKYDFGIKKNYEFYKQATPPAYNLSSIEETCYLFVGSSDKLAVIEDVRELQKSLKKNVYKEYQLGHLSFMIAKDMSYLRDAMNIIKDNGL